MLSDLLSILYKLLHSQVLLAEMESLFCVKNDIECFHGQLLVISRVAKFLIYNVLTVTYEYISDLLCLTRFEYEWLINIINQYALKDFKQVIECEDYVLIIQKVNGFVTIKQKVEQKEKHVILSPEDVFSLRSYNTINKLIGKADIEYCSLLLSHMK